MSESPLSDLRQALATCSDEDVPLISAARAALQWMNEEPDRLAKAWDEGHEEGQGYGYHECGLTDEPIVNPYRREGAANDH